MPVTVAGAKGGYHIPSRGFMSATILAPERACPLTMTVSPGVEAVWLRGG